MHVNMLNVQSFQGGRLKVTVRVVIARSIYVKNSELHSVTSVPVKSYNSKTDASIVVVCIAC